MIIKWKYNSNSFQLKKYFYEDRPMRLLEYCIELLYCILLNWTVIPNLSKYPLQAAQVPLGVHIPLVESHWLNNLYYILRKKTFDQQVTL